MISLATLPFELTAEQSAQIATIVMGFLLFFVIISIAIYVYLSLAFTAIGRRAGLSSPGLAWIPGVGLLITAYRTSKMHWWPWLLLISPILMFVPAIGGLLYALGFLVFMVFAIIWQWKMFEAVGRPGWWAILQIIPIVNLAYFVLIGVAAWGKNAQVAA